MNKKQKMDAAILSHGLTLIRHYGNGSGGGPVTLCKALRRAETRMHRIAEEYCNGTVTDERLERANENARKAALRLLPKLNPEHLHINQDPRGYALKIETEYTPTDLHRDWGGYGIIAPDLTE